MKTTTKVTRSGQITIPVVIREQMNIEEGDLLDVRVENGHIVLVPLRLVDADQAYFWTEAWQAAEREAQEDIDAGRVKTFETVGELLADLEA